MNGLLHFQDGSLTSRLSLMQLTSKAASDMKYIMEEAKRKNMTEFLLYQAAMTDVTSFIQVPIFP